MSEIRYQFSDYLYVLHDKFCLLHDKFCHAYIYYFLYIQVAFNMEAEPTIITNSLQNNPADSPDVDQAEFVTLQTSDGQIVIVKVTKQMVTEQMELQSENSQQIVNDDVVETGKTIYMQDQQFLESVESSDLAPFSTIDRQIVDDSVINSDGQSVKLENNINECIDNVYEYGAGRRNVSIEKDNNIGRIMMYYCKSCKKHSPSIHLLEQHVKLGNCEKNDQLEPNCLDVIYPNSRRGYDHCYATISCNTSDIDDSNRSKDSGTNINTETNTTTTCRSQNQYECSLCPHTKIYSKTELDIHKKCHNASGLNVMLTCYFCQTNTGNKSNGHRGRRLGISVDWRKIKIHLAKIHEIDFMLKCKFCDFDCSSHANMDIHYQQHNTKCKYCPYSTAYDDDLNVHERCHVTRQVFQCCFCAEGLHNEHQTDWNVVHEHLLKTHPDTIRQNYVCQRCGKGFQHSTDHENHYRKCVMKVECDQCREFIFVTKIIQHMHDNHSESQVDVSMLPVEASYLPIITDGSKDKCDDSSTSSPHQDIKSDKDEFQCHRHDLYFTSKNEMEAHFISEHSRTKQRKYFADYEMDFDDDIKYDVNNMKESAASACEDNISSHNCDSIVENSSAIDDTVTHKEDKKVACFVKEAPDSVYESSEMTKVKPGRRGRPKLLTEPSSSVKCEHCYKKFANQWRLSAHKNKSHSEDKMKPLACSYCQKLFRNQVQRRNHVRQVHEGIKRLQKINDNPKLYLTCSLCPYQSPDKARLSAHHQAVHLGVIHFRCEYCNYTTKERSDFHRHKLRHLGVKRHQCPCCAYQCLERWVMVSHCLKQHQLRLPKISRNTRGGPCSIPNLKRNHNQNQDQDEVAIASEHVEAVYLDSDKGTNVLDADSNVIGNNDTGGYIIAAVDEVATKTLIQIAPNQSGAGVTLSADNYIAEVAGQTDIQNIVNLPNNISEVREVTVGTDTCESGVVYIDTVQVDNCPDVDNQIIYLDQPMPTNVQYVVIPSANDMMSDN